MGSQPWASGAIVPSAALAFPAFCTACGTTEEGRRRIYQADDNHTDYMWSAGVGAYDAAFTAMVDW